MTAIWKQVMILVMVNTKTKADIPQQTFNTFVFNNKLLLHYGRLFKANSTCSRLVYYVF